MDYEKKQNAKECTLQSLKVLLPRPIRSKLNKNFYFDLFDIIMIN